MKFLPKPMVLLALLVFLPLRAVSSQTEAVTIEFPSSLADTDTISKESSSVKLPMKLHTTKVKLGLRRYLFI